MNARTVEEPLRDRVGRALYEEPGAGYNWYDLSEERREPWRKDADRVIEVVMNDNASVLAEAWAIINAAGDDSERFEIALEVITQCKSDFV